MKPTLTRLSIRSVQTTSLDKMRTLKLHTRLSPSLLIEDAIDLLWDQYFDEGQDDD